MGQDSEDTALAAEQGDGEAPAKAATLADVARASGVAPATVSRALNTPDLVKPPTRARIMAAVARLGYYANPAARALAGSTWRTVGVLAPSLDHIMFHHQLAVFEQEMTARGFSLLISATNYDPESEVRLVHSLLGRGVDGVLLTHVDQPDFLFGQLANRGVPHVLMSSVEIEGAVRVGYDEIEGMRTVVDHLHALGHRRFAMIGDRRAQVCGENRIGAVAARLKELDLELPPERVFRCGADPAEPRAAFRKIMAMEARPTAIVCGNDNLALAAMAEAAAMGVSVPDEVSLTGFDGIDIAAHPRISLTTIRAPWRRLGRFAAETLNTAIEGGIVESRLVPTELTAGDSTAPPPAGD